MEKELSLELSQEIIKGTCCGRGLSCATALGVWQELTALKVRPMQGSSQAGSSQVWQEQLLFSLLVGSLWPFVHFDRVQRLLENPQSFGSISKISQKGQPAFQTSTTAAATHLNLTCTPLIP